MKQVTDIFLLRIKSLPGLVLLGSVLAIGLVGCSVSSIRGSSSGGGGDDDQRTEASSQMTITPGLGLAQVFADPVYTVGMEVMDQEALELPTSTSLGVVDYSLTPDIPEMRFDKTTRQLAGTPTEAGTYEMTYTAQMTEDGQQKSQSVRFTVSVLQDSGHDLVVESVSADDITLGTGQDFRLSVRVRNSASSTVISARTLRYYRSSDAIISSSDSEISAAADTISNLASAASTSEDASLTAPSVAGTYYYGACVDSANTTVHCSAGVEVRVLVAADMYFVGLPAVSVARPDAGESFSLTLTVGNRGEVAPPSGTQLRYYRSTDSTITASDISVGTGAVGALGASASRLEMLSLTAPLIAGRHYYGACVEGVEYDRNPADNCSPGVPVDVAGNVVRFPLRTTIPDQTYTTGRPITPLALPLAVCDLTCAPGDVVQYSFAEPLPDGLALSLGGNVPRLDGTPTANSGPVVLTYRAIDPLGNSAVLTFHVTILAGPDLYLKTLHVNGNNSAVLAPGELLELQAVVENSGDSAAGATIAQWYQSTDTIIDTTDAPVSMPSAVSALAEAGMLDLATSWIVQIEGGFYFGVCIVPADNEHNVTNNCSDALRVWVQGADVAPAFPTGTISDQRYLQGEMITDLVLPQASGGNGPLSYPDTLVLPAGLIYQEREISGINRRVISGTVSSTAALQSYLLVYTAIDSDNNTAASDTATVVFTIAVEAMSALAYQPGSLPSALSYQTQDSIPPLVLPAAEGGFGEKHYSISFEGVAGYLGMSFHAGTRTLSGIPALPDGVNSQAINVIYRATDAVGNTLVSRFNMTVERKTPPVLTPPTSGSISTYLLNQLMSQAFPGATAGNGVLSYSLVDAAGNLPPGLSFDNDPAARILSGVPSAAGVYDLIYETKDENNNSDTQLYTIVVQHVDSGSPEFASGVVIDNKTYLHGVPVVNLILPEATGNDGPLTYSLALEGTDGLLPPGLSFVAETRTLSGIPEAVADHRLVYTVRDYLDNNDTDATVLTFTVAIEQNRPSFGGQTIPDQIYNAYDTITPMTLPEAIGGNGELVYKLLVPQQSLEFDSTSRVLSGFLTKDDALSPDTYSMVYEVQDADDDSSPNDSDTLEFAITVNRAIADFVLRQGEYVSLPFVSQDNGQATYYRLSGPCPEGLTFDALTQTLSGTPNAASMGMPVTLVYELHNAPPPESCRSDSQASSNSLIAQSSFNILVQENAIPAFNQKDQFSGYYEFQQNIAITSAKAIQLPNATVGHPGNDVLQYSISGLPDGMQYEEQEVAGVTTRRVAGTPTQHGLFNLTYVVTNPASNDTDTIHFSILIKAIKILQFSWLMPDLIVLVDQPMRKLILPISTSSQGTLSYDFAGTLPSDLQFDASTRALTGTPGTARSIPLIYKVRNRDDSGVLIGVRMMSFTLTVVTGDDHADFGSEPLLRQLQFTEGIPVDQALPTAMGGYLKDGGVLRYSLSGILPEGLRFVDADAGTNEPPRIIGTPEMPTAQPASVIYSVSDDLQNRAVDDRAVLHIDIHIADYTPTFGTDQVPDQLYPAGFAIPALVLPNATGGNGTLTYRLDGLPAGLQGARQAYLSSVGGPAQLVSGTPEAPSDPSGFATSTVTYTATDADGDTAVLNFEVSVQGYPNLAGMNLVPTFSGQAIPDQLYTVGLPVNLVFPEATGGNGPLAYSLGTANPFGGTFPPAGLVYRETVVGGQFVRTLSGTPTTAFGGSLTPLAWRARDSVDGENVSRDQVDEVELNFTITIHADTAPSFGDSATKSQVAHAVANNQIYYKGRAINDLKFPRATGGNGGLSYSLSAQPDGMDLVDGTRLLSGASGEVGTFTMVYTVTDADGDTDSITIPLTVRQPPLVVTAVAVDDNSVDPGQALAITVQVHNDGTVARNASLTFYLSPGAIITTDDTKVGFPASVIHLAAGTSASYTSLGVTAETNLHDYYYGACLVTTIDVIQATECSEGVVVAVIDKDAAPIPLSLVNSTAGSDLRVFFKQHQDVSHRFPQAIGGTPPYTYQVIETPDSLPTGLHLDPLRGRSLSGTPTVPETARMLYRVTDSDAQGSNTVEVELIITVDGPPSFNGQTIDHQEYIQNSPVDFPLPIASGGNTDVNPLRYSLSSRVPLVGLMLDTTISPGAPRLRGTPTAPIDAGSVFYSVHDDDNDSATLIFNLEVVEDLAPSFATGAVINDLNLIAGGDFTEDGNSVLSPLISLPIASGGNTGAGGGLTYSLTPALPAGIVFDDDSTGPSLEGRPHAGVVMLETTYSYRVTDVDGDSQALIFKIAVLADVTPTFDSTATIATKKYVAGVDITSMPLSTHYPVGPLPQAIGGNGVVSYSIEGPTWLQLGACSSAPTFNCLSGVPSVGDVTTGAVVGTYRVTDVNGDTDTLTFGIEVLADLTPAFAAGAMIGDLSLIAGSDITKDRGTVAGSNPLPIAIGGNQLANGALAYSLTPTLPMGMSLGIHVGTKAPILSGMPHAGVTMSATTYTYTAMDANGTTSTNGLTFNIEVLADVTPAFSGTIEDKKYIEGVDIASSPFSGHYERQLPHAGGGNGEPAYSLDGGPAWLTTGLCPTTTFYCLVGTPGAGDLTMTAMTLTYRATDANGDSDALTFDIEVSVDLVPAFPVGISIADQVYIENTAITELSLPTAVGGNPEMTYNFDLSLPTGVTASPDATTGALVLSGTPMEVVNQRTYTYGAEDANGTATVNRIAFTIDVLSDSMPSFGSGTISNQRYLEGTDVNLIFPQGSDGNTNTGLIPAADVGYNGLRYKLERVLPSGTTDEQLPPGLTFNNNNNTNDIPSLSGTVPVGVSSATSAAETYRFTVMDDDGDTAVLEFSMAVDKDPSFPIGTAITSKTAIQSLAIDSLSYNTLAIRTLPEATPGNGGTQYELVDVPNGIYLGGTTGRELLGTPLVAGIFNVIYRAKDADTGSVPDTADVLFTLVVEADTEPSFASGRGQGDVVLVQGTPSVNLQLAEYDGARRFDGGNDPVTYSLNGEPPPGLTFNPNKGALEGTPTTPGATTMTLVVTDVDGGMGSYSLTVTIIENLVPQFASGINLLDREYGINTDISIVETAILPAATGGNTGGLSLSYSFKSISPLVGNATAPSFAVDSNRRMIGTTGSAPGSFTATYVVHDSDTNFSDADSDTLTIDVTLHTVLFPSAMRDTPTFNASNTIYGAGFVSNFTINNRLTLPEVQGGVGTLSYQVLDGSGAVVATNPFHFDPATRRLTTPSTLPLLDTFYYFTYRVTDSATDIDYDEEFVIQVKVN